MSSSGVSVRHRAEADIDACVAIAAAVQVDSGYPHPSVTDLRSFVAPGYATAAWVAVDAARSGEVVGHVALHPRGSDQMQAVVRTAVGDAPFSVISRLFVSPTLRRAGAGRLLLETATRDAIARGLVPVLDVSIHFDPANALYRACGWEQIGTASVPLRGGVIFDENVYRYAGA
jgi:GNAT superfamily N-acetyltransferase